MKLLICTILMLTCLSGCAVFSGDSGEHKSRTFGTVFDDQIIESKGRVRIKRAHPDLKKAHIIVTSFNGIVLLIGQVASEELKILSAKQFADFQKVRRVYNEIQIAGPTSIFSRGNDSWLTTKIKAKMLTAKAVDASRVKVVTENGVVYLLGLVTEDEAAAAVDLTRRVYGVQKVVKVFEIVDPVDIPRQDEKDKTAKETTEELI